MRMMSRHSGRMAVGFLVVLIWAACFVVIKASQGDSPPLLYGALRALVGGIPLLPLAALTGRFLPPPRSWGWITLLGLTGTTLGFGGMFLSVKAVGAALPAVLANSQALLVALLAALLFGERMTIGRVIGLLIGIIGIALTTGGNGETKVTTGAALGLMAGAGLAGGNLIIKHIGFRVDALTATAWQYVLGGLPLLGWSLMVEDPGQLGWTPGFVTGLLFLGLVGSAGASWVWYWLVRDGELISLNGLTLLTPGLGVLLALLIYREPLSILGMLGMAMVLVGVIWVCWPQRSTGRRLGLAEVQVRESAWREGGRGGRL